MRELLERLRGEGWAYNTLKTMLTRMEEKGLVSAEMRGGRTFYAPRVEQGVAQRSAVRALIERVFEGAAGPLLAQLVDDQSLKAADRKKLEGWLSEIDRRERKHGRR